MQKETTRLNSLLDLFFTNNESLISLMETAPGISTVNEHVAIVTDLNLKAELSKSAPHKINQWSKVNWENVRGKAKAFADQFCVEALGKSVDEQWGSIETFLDDILKTHVPFKFTKTRADQPWLNKDLKRRCRRKQRLYNKWKNLKSKKKPCKAARENYKKFHQDTNTLLSKARNQYINNILTEGLETKSQKPFWRYIKSQRTESTGVAPLKEAGEIHSNSNKKASILANQFRSVFTLDDDDSVNTYL